MLIDGYMKLARIVFFCLLTALSTSGIAFAQAPPTQGSKNSKTTTKYLQLPDGSSVPLREGEDPEVVWRWAQQKYPEAFGVFPAGALYDADYFNSCVLKDLGQAKGDFAVAQLNQVCKHKATPKRCRSVATDIEKARCVKSCKEAGYLSNTVGDCSKG